MSNQSTPSTKTPTKSVTGVLDVNPKGFGFLRQQKRFYGESSKDPFVSPDLIRRNGLKSGVYLTGDGGTGKAGKPVLKNVKEVNGMHPREFRALTPFHRGVSSFPDERIHLETPGGPLSMRVIDLVAPLGKGSRSLVVSPPKAGKTTILKELVQAVTANHPEIITYALLIDERPEEVTDMQRSIKGEIIASSMDQNIGSHVRLTRLTAEIVKRRVETGEDVLLVLDSITRVSRAFNNYEGNSGRTMSGGLDSTAMEFPRSLFGSARKIESSGSLTIVGTALVDTGSRMDELIFQEFQGTGNQEIFLDRKLADKRVWPAINIVKSRTRKEELLLSKEEYEATTRMRRGLAGMNMETSSERLIDTLKKYESNAEFMKVINSTGAR